VKSGIIIKKFPLVFIYLVNYPLYLVSTRVPKNPDLWIFGSRQGEAFAENAKYLFRYIHENRRDIKAVWLTKKRSVLKQARKLGLTCYYCHSPRGYYYSMRAGAVFITHFKPNRYDLNFYVLTPGTLRVQLWHGSPIKKIIFDNESSEFCSFEKSVLHRALKRVFPFHRDKFIIHSVIAASGTVADPMASAYRLNRNDVLVTGYPKNDGLFKKPAAASEDERRRIIFMPTFREENRDFTFFSGYNFNITRLSESLRKLNAGLYIKLHPYTVMFHGGEIKRQLGAVNGESPVRLYFTEDIYETLWSFDMLVTDYSSVVFDYLLLDRPVIFTPFDMEEYRKHEYDFYHDYPDIAPGPVASDWDDVIYFIERFTAEPRWFRHEREIVRDRFNRYQDGNSSERIIAMVKTRLRR